MTEDLDATTIARATAGNAASIELVVKGLQGRYFALARRMMLDPADAEDATQEALLRVVTHLGQFRGESKFETWAWRIGVNTFLEFRQQKYRLPLLSVGDFARDLADGLELEATERADDAALYEQVKEGCGIALLGTLDADHRLAYVLGELLELDGDTAAEVLEVEPATYRKRLSRARERVREALAQTCGVFEASNPCRCHCRLTRAVSLGRCGPGGGAPRVDLPAVREQLARLDVLERAAAFYKADGTPTPRTDLVEKVRGLLQSARLSPR